MKIDINEEHLLSYFSNGNLHISGSPEKGYFSIRDRKPCIANFMKEYNFMREDSAKVCFTCNNECCQNLFSIYIEIGNGNHFRDFDEIQINLRNTLPLITIHGIFEEFHRGYGSITCYEHIHSSLAMRIIEIIKR